MQNAAPFLKNTYTWVSAEAGRTAAQAMTSRTATVATPNRTSPPVFHPHAHCLPLLPPAPGWNVAIEPEMDDDAPFHAAFPSIEPVYRTVLSFATARSKQPAAQKT